MIPEEEEIVKRHPIKDGLAAFRGQYESSQAHLGIESSTVVEILSASGQDLLLSLIPVFLGHPASRQLHSRINNNTLFTDLFNVTAKITSGGFDIQLAVPLVRLIIDNAPDIEIWDALFKLVEQAGLIPTTPPTALTDAFIDTPSRPNSSLQRGIEEKRLQVDQRIRGELDGRVYDDVPGFFERYFEGKAWTNQAGEIYKASISQYTDGRWNNWPEPPVENAFFTWFMHFQDEVLGGLSRKYYTSANKKLTGSEASRKLDLFLASSDTPSQAGSHDWSNVLVIGELKQNPGEDRLTTTLVQLTGYAREVFGNQPDRRFVPGFTICGSLMRLWLFDRSGAYSSDKFNIHIEPERFVRVIAGYALMTDAELGLNTFINRDGNGRYIVTQDMRIYLEDKPIASQKAVVSRGTACYRGRQHGTTEWKYVVKFAWPSGKRHQEGRLLKLAKERGVIGIAQWVHDEEVFIDGVADTIANLRDGLEFSKLRKISSKADMESSQADSKPQSGVISLTGPPAIDTKGSSISSGQKRKLEDERPAVETSSSKKSKSGDSQSLSRLVDKDAKKDESHKSNTHGHGIQESEVDNDETYGNRIHCCLVVSPAGRPLSSYKSITELLETFRDAIKGHKSLFIDGKILHRDISENNIIITNPTAEGDPKGMLIDLDLAKVMGDGPSGARHRTGTMQFMAIGVLQGYDHTYRHDLESFFYVFIWMCICYGHGDMNEQRWVRLKGDSKLHKWYLGTYDDIADSKAGAISTGFHLLIAEFAPRFTSLKGLAKELKIILFGKELSLKPHEDCNIMYDGMINAFEKAIRMYGENEA
ncbi:hypothetical protein B7494_g6812 [Chlorociboria aeruginascens]|nr:hypothetical protein B7494_g6812 [Chlorociboria aeruginascens]